MSNPRSVSRRRFFKNGAASTAALAVAPGAGAYNLAESNGTAAASSLSVQTDMDEQIMTAGRMPLAATDSDKFNSLVRSAATVSKPVLAGTEPPASFPTEFLPIDVAINSDPDFGLDTIETAAAQFKFWQIESLLDQAADLLDRCTRDRTEYDQLRSQWAKLFLEVTEFDQYEAIHQGEIKAG